MPLFSNTKKRGALTMGNYIPHLRLGHPRQGLKETVRKFLHQKKDKFLLCSHCFNNEGLRIDANTLGADDTAPCENCGSKSGRKLDAGTIATLAHRFFVLGTLHRCEYGAAPIVQFNYQQTTDINTSPWFEADLRLIERTMKVGFFYYGPRLWMVGEVEPLKALESMDTRATILGRIVNEYPVRTLNPGDHFYRLRVSPTVPDDPNEYDSPPQPSDKPGRLDSAGLRVMYGSQDLQLCIHECRVTADDQLFVATLTPNKEFRLLDLTHLLVEEDATEFESLDMAVHMLFLAGIHSYDIAREIALAAQAAGLDGLLYPSYFSLLRTGGMPFETLLGISHRKIARFADREKSKIVPNIAIFGRPIRDKTVEVKSINRLFLNRVEYGFHFGPVGYEWVETPEGVSCSRSTEGQ